MQLREPINEKQGSWTKYGYVPTPINKPNTPESNTAEVQQEENETKERIPEKERRRFRRRRQRVNVIEKKQEKRSYIHPTSSIGIHDLYWFPVFWISKRPDDKNKEFRRSFVTLIDKQRVLVKTFWNGKITVWRAGEEITLKKPDSNFGERSKTPAKREN